MAALETLIPVFVMLGLGLVARWKSWVSLDQKTAVNHIVFDLLFPVLVFSLLAQTRIEVSHIGMIGYIFSAFCICLGVGVVLGKWTGKRYEHFSPFLLTTVEGGNVALPLYMSIVGATSLTVIFDLAGTLLCFILYPIWIAKKTATASSMTQLLTQIMTQPFVLAVLGGLIFQLSGIYAWLEQSAYMPIYTGVINQMTAPIIPLILFILGYDLKVEAGMLKPLLKLVGLRVGLYALIIAGFFILFPSQMADPIFRMGTFIYFMCPPGFGLIPIISPLLQQEDDGAFASTFISAMMVVALFVYTFVVLFIA